MIEHETTFNSLGSTIQNAIMKKNPQKMILFSKNPRVKITIVDE